MESSLQKEVKHLVFVYGTLKRNEPNYKFWSVENYCGNISTQLKKGRFHLLATGETVRKFPLVIATKHNVSFSRIKYHILNYNDDRYINSLNEVEDGFSISFLRFNFRCRFFYISLDMVTT